MFQIGPARRVLIASLVLVASFVEAPVADAATAPPTLNGELFYFQDNPYAPVGSFTITGTCSTTGPSTFSFTGSGVPVNGILDALPAPYSGTAYVQGTFTLSAPDPSRVRQLTGFTESFTINSPAATVTGTKEFLPDTTSVPGLGSGGPGGGCHPEGTPFQPGTLAQAVGFSTYSATIRTSQGTYTDKGYASTYESQYLGASGPGVKEAVFHENFLSEGTAALPTLPTIEDQCKNDGYRSYGIFKNQGDCVSFVVTFGKNAPAGL